MNKRLAYPLLGLLSVVLGVGIARRVTAGPQTQPGPTDKLAAARVVAPRKGTDERTPIPAGKLVAANGVVEPSDREIRVAGQIAGRISRVAVKEGDHLAPGDVVVALEDGLEAAALAAAEAEVSVANAELAKVVGGLRREEVGALDADRAAFRTKAALSGRDLTRVQALFDAGSVSASELDAARSRRDADVAAATSAEARLVAARGGRPEDVSIARAKVSGAIARREEASEGLQRLTVRAPVAGEVLSVKVRVGEYYAPGAEPLVILGDTRELRARIDVDERDVARIRKGAAGFATLLAYPDKRFRGSVVEIGHRMGRKNVRTDDPVERLDTKILEVVMKLDDTTGLVPGERVTAYVETP